MAKAKLHVTTETATVYRAPERRYLTKRSAYLAAARHELLKGGCECQPGSMKYGDYGEVCELHDNGCEELDKQAAVLADQFQADDAELLKQGAPDD